MGEANERRKEGRNERTEVRKIRSFSLSYGDGDDGDEFAAFTPARAPVSARHDNLGIPIRVTVQSHVQTFLTASQNGRMNYCSLLCIFGADSRRIYSRLSRHFAGIFSQLCSMSVC